MDKIDENFHNKFSDQIVDCVNLEHKFIKENKETKYVVDLFQKSNQNVHNLYNYDLDKNESQKKIVFL